MATANLTEIEKNPNYWFDKMTPLELQRFEDSYYSRLEREAIRIAKIRVDEELREFKKQAREEARRLRELELEQRRAEKAKSDLKKYQGKVFNLYRMLKHLHLENIEEHDISYLGRSVSNTIHDLPYIWTGYESENSYKERLYAKECGKSYEVCREHFWPRQWAGEYIIRHIVREKGISLGELAAYCDMFRHVHHVTSQENWELRPHQKVCNFVSPRKSYEDAGIELMVVEEKDTDCGW